MSEEKITLYISSSTSSNEIRKRTTRIQDVFTALSIPFECTDVTSSPEVLSQMREEVGISTCTPPQIVRAGKGCGTYDDFENAVEDKCVKQWLGLEV